MFGRLAFNAFHALDAFTRAAAPPALRAFLPAPPPPPHCPVMDHSHPAAWQAHHAAMHHLSQRHAGTANPGHFSVGAGHQANASPLRFIRSTLDYSQLPLSQAVGRQPQGNIHRVLTPQGYPTGMVLVVNPSSRLHRIPREIERLARLSEQGVPVPEILSYGNFRGHSAMLMRENAPFYAAMGPAGHRGHRAHS